MIRHWSIVATAAAAVLGFSTMALAQTNASGDRDSSQGGMMISMTTPQVAALVKHAKHSLTDSIGAAERHCKGHAVRAECRRGADAGTVCVVTLLVGDKRLVEATVNTQTGEVTSQRDVARLSYIGMTRADGDDQFAMARRWQRVTDLKGKKVSNAAGENLGQLEEIVVDAGSGRTLYGVLSFGGFLGLGDKLFAIPWQSLQLTDGAKGFTLNVDKDRLKNATGFSEDRWPDLANEQFATSTYEYYGQKPYWHSRDGDVQLAADNSGEARESNRDRWNRRTTVWQKCGDLCGKEVRTVQTDDVGKLDDMVVDPDSGRVLYGILSYRGRLFAVPWNVLTLNTNAEQLVLHAEEKQLSDRFSFSKDNWPNLVDQDWATALHAHYNIEPYWVVEGK
jgi:sporulation protein YlmC with PRC-barrel domain